MGCELLLLYVPKDPTWSFITSGALLTMFGILYIGEFFVIGMSCFIGAEPVLYVAEDGSRSTVSSVACSLHQTPSQFGSLLRP